MDLLQAEIEPARLKLNRLLKDIEEVKSTYPEYQAFISDALSKPGTAPELQQQQQQLPGTPPAQQQQLPKTPPAQPGSSSSAAAAVRPSHWAPRPPPRAR